MVQGQAEGEADAIFRVLEARGVKVTLAERRRVTDCRDLEQLREWVTLAVTAEKASDIFR
jgi:hypothetical protein